MLRSPREYHLGGNWATMDSLCGCGASMTLQLVLLEESFGGIAASVKLLLTKIHQACFRINFLALADVCCHPTSFSNLLIW